MMKLFGDLTPRRPELFSDKEAVEILLSGVAPRVIYMGKN
jgi:hypothetical protein